MDDFERINRLPVGENRANLLWCWAITKMSIMGPECRAINVAIGIALDALERIGSHKASP